MEQQDNDGKKARNILVLENSLNVGGLERLLYDILLRVRRRGDKIKD